MNNSPKKEDMIFLHTTIGCASSRAFHSYSQICRSPLGLMANWYFVCPHRTSNPAVCIPWAARWCYCRSCLGTRADICSGTFAHIGKEILYVKYCTILEPSLMWCSTVLIKKTEFASMTAITVWSLTTSVTSGSPFYACWHMFSLCSQFSSFY